MNADSYLRKALHERVGFVFTQTEELDEQATWSAAVTLYRKGEFGQAQELFAKLVHFDPFSAEYWMALASALHGEEKYEPALASYAMAGILDEKDPSPHFHAAQIFYDRGECNDFADSLELARARCHLQAGRYDLLEKIQGLEGQFQLRWGKHVTRCR